MNDVAWLEFETNLRAYVRRRVDGAATDDVVGEILLRLVRSRDKMEGAKTPIAWVYRVAANAISDHHRSNASRQRMLTAVELETMDTNSTDLESDATDSLARCLIPMIKNLPAPYDTALMLTDIDGNSQVAVAKRSGLSVSGMKSRVQRARQKLKTSLLRCCEVEVNSVGNVLSYEKRKASPCCGDLF